MASLINLTRRNYAHYFAVIIFITVLILAILLRIRTLYDFCFIFADSDQYVEWAAANDMHHGLFHEPCFYGQSYNPLFEPLFAQPLIFAGIPLRMALPMISGILGFLPYLILGWAFFKSKNYFSAVFAFTFLLWLPIEFQVITSIPRGYLPACAFAAVGTYFGLFSKYRFRFFLFGFLCALAFFTSQNSVFLVFPVSVYLLSSHFRDRKFYLQILTGILASLPVPVFISWFYHMHPSYNKHHWDLDFSFATFKEGVMHADKYFNFFSPYAGFKFYTLIFIFLIFLTISLVRQHYKFALSIISGFLLLLFSLAFDKFHDGTANVFYSGVRMYLGVPLSIIIFCFWAESALKSKKGNRNYLNVQLAVLLLLSLFFFIQRNLSFAQTLYAYPGKPDMLIAGRITLSQKYCDKIGVLCRKHHSGLVIFENWRETMGINYMSSALNYPYKSLIPYGDRRAWALEEENSTIRDNFIYLPEDMSKIKSLQSNGIPLEQISINPSAWLVQTNGMRVFDILKDKFADQRE